MGVVGVAPGPLHPMRHSLLLSALLLSASALLLSFLARTAAPVQQEHQANPSNHGANPLIRPPAIRGANSLDEMQTVSANSGSKRVSNTNEEAGVLVVAAPGRASSSAPAHVAENQWGHIPAPSSPDFAAKPGESWAAILSDRPNQTLGTIASALSAGTSAGITWLVITSGDESDVVRASLLARGVRSIVLRLPEVETVLERQGVSLVWRSEAGLCDPKLTNLSLRTHAWDMDAKHHHPLKLLRFYLHELPLLKNATALLLLDDDVLVNKPLDQLFLAEATFRDGARALRRLGAEGSPTSEGAPFFAPGR